MALRIIVPIWWASLVLHSVQLKPELDGHRPMWSFEFVGLAKSFAIAATWSLADAVGRPLHFAVANAPVDVALVRLAVDFAGPVAHFVGPIGRSTACGKGKTNRVSESYSIDGHCCVAKIYSLRCLAAMQPLSQHSAHCPWKRKCPILAFIFDRKWFFLLFCVRQLEIILVFYSSNKIKIDLKIRLK